MFRFILVVLAMLQPVVAVAQWQVPINTLPYGKGAGKTGFGAVPNSGTGTLCLTDTSPPTWQPCIASDRIANASGSAQTTTGTISSSSMALTLSSALDFVDGQGILVNHAGAAFSGSIGVPVGGTVTPVGTTGSTTYSYKFQSINASGGYGIASSAIQTTTGNATLGKFSSSHFEYNLITWTPGANTTYTAIWRSTNGGSYGLCGIFDGSIITYSDMLPCNSSIPFWMPSSPAVANAASWLKTTISSGGGSTSLTLVGAAGANATGVFVQHDDTDALAAALAASTNISLGAGTYNVTALSIPSGMKSFVCPLGAASTKINPIGTTNIAGQPTALGGDALADNFVFKGCSINVLQAMATSIAGLVISNSSAPEISNNILSGRVGFYSIINAYPMVLDNVINNYFNTGLSSYRDTYPLLDGNLVKQPAPRDLNSIGISVSGDAATVAGNGGTVTGNTVQGDAVFGILCGNTSMLIANNNITASLQEAIHGTTGCQNFNIIGNTINGAGASIDNGISFADEINFVSGVGPGLVSGNNINAVGLACVAIAGNIGTNDVSYITVSGNYGFNCLDASGSLVATNIGYVIYGVHSKHNIIAYNTLRDTNGLTQFMAGEFTSAGTPSDNIIGPHTGEGYVTAYNVVGTNSTTSNVQFSNTGFAQLPSCSTQLQSARAYVLDSNTNTWGATIAGGGANAIQAVCNGTNWTVTGK